MAHTLTHSQCTHKLTALYILHIVFRTDNFGNVCLRRCCCCCCCCVDENPMEGMLQKTTMTLVFQRFVLFYSDGSLPSLLLLLSPPNDDNGDGGEVFVLLLLLTSRRTNVWALLSAGYCVYACVEALTLPTSSSSSYCCYLAKIYQRKKEMSKNKHSKDMYEP